MGKIENTPNPTISLRKIIIVDEANITAASMAPQPRNCLMMRSIPDII